MRAVVLLLLFLPSAALAVDPWPETERYTEEELNDAYSNKENPLVFYLVVAIGLGTFAFLQRNSGPKPISRTRQLEIENETLREQLAALEQKHKRLLRRRRREEETE